MQIICSKLIIFFLQDFLDQDVCWGHEPNCPMEKAFQTPECPGDHQGWVKNKDTQVDTFYSQADFGYLKQQMNQMKIMCEPLFKVQFFTL